MLRKFVYSKLEEEWNNYRYLLLHQVYAWCSEEPDKRVGCLGTGVTGQ